MPSSHGTSTAPWNNGFIAVSNLWIGYLHKRRHISEERRMPMMYNRGYSLDIRHDLP